MVSMKRRRVLQTTFGGIVVFSGCSAIQSNRTPTDVENSTTENNADESTSTGNPEKATPSRECDAASEVRIRIDNAVENALEVTIVVNSISSNEDSEEIFSTTREIDPAPDDADSSGFSTVWIEGVVSEAGTYDVKVSLSNENSTDYEWEVHDSCDELNIQIQDNKEIVILSVREG